MTVLSTVKTAVEKRAKYLRTKAELQRMPQEVAIDLGIFREDAGKIAYRAVYG
ncbi:hypothetical protein SAMN04488515_1312 [Cognatiyoonia koreensis]|uniref:DUF1127 domain-containing protein n=1 Tax=Cognatiyoonia koreensis TaxID=364200 RepID=A0A1I0PNW9_9RHOB|nr:hypothetical protein [Cognatiyoonia koreensis]SEW15528.1 hypothetical protein SAMN04488515_1312 [Cognatiyoonia koreensis]